MPDREYQVVPVFDTISRDNVPEGYAFGAVVGGYAAVSTSSDGEYFLATQTVATTWESDGANGHGRRTTFSPQIVECQKMSGWDYYLFPDELMAQLAIEQFARQPR